MEKEYTDELSELATEIEKSAPNLKAIEKFKEVKDKMNATREAWDEKKVEAQVLFIHDHIA
jgi:hypothetical protein